MKSRVAAALVATAALVVAVPAAASAHPLGNFTVNHYDGLRLFPDRVDDLAVVAEGIASPAGELPRR